MNWHLIYKKFTQALSNLYAIHKQNTGEYIYQLLLNNSRFIELNPWFANFTENSNINSIDPIHFFSSFNGNNLADETRSKRMSILLEILQIDLPIGKVNFSGCPTPTIINLLSVRSIENQKEIWEIFYSLTVNPDNLSKLHFDKMEKWYGVALPSFTIFLFWIDSDCFLPLDANTVGFLLATNKIEKTPKNYSDYAYLLTLKRKISFRELALVAYLFMVENKREINYTKKFSRFLNLKGLDVFSAENFKLIAIKVKNYKNITTLFSPDKYYSFFDCYDLKNPESIKFLPELDIDFYNNSVQNINISAIVGKNGSGKSTLVELLFIAINNLTKATENIINTEPLKFVRNVDLELLIMTTALFRIKITNQKVEVFRYDFDGSYYTNPTLIDTSLFLKEYFFYTIAINHSHYSLNSKLIGKWINPLFHKNDSYQTPLVINPKRSAGNININTENKLANSRLISMILFPLNKDIQDPLINSFRNLTNDGENFKFAHSLNLKLDDNKLKTVREVIISNKFKFELTEADGGELLNEIYVKFEIPKDCLMSENYIIKYSNEYILKKAIQISQTYRQYKFFVNPKTKKIINPKQFVDELEGDNSHITFKLRQVINFLRFDHLRELKDVDDYTYSVEELSTRIEDIRRYNKKIRIAELIPPSIFEIEIELEHSKDKSKSEFEDLSSGEKQRIYSISSLIYHLINLDSVVQKEGIIVYNRINIVFDEIELYYHPEFQRRFIDDILKSLEILKQYLERIKDINFSFITHSPFILSDIPNSNVLFLDNHSVVKPETFASNIHELLATSFFLSDGFVGEFSKKIINALFRYLNNIEELDKEFTGLFDEEKAKHIIQYIGEPILKSELSRLFDIKFKKSTEIDFINKEIERLEQLKKQKINDSNNPSKT